jgi:hypothetical protein
MTAPMIEWTLELLAWIREQIFEHWPQVRLRGSAPDVDPTPYGIRFRDENTEYWLTLLPATMTGTGVDEVQFLLEGENWISLLKEWGSITVGTEVGSPTRPALILPDRPAAA